MITALDVAKAKGISGIATLFERLGYPVAPVEIDAGEWRRAGVVMPWNGESKVHLMCRMDRFDLFLLEGDLAPAEQREFMISYGEYNRLTKSALINISNKENTITIAVLADRNQFRRFTFDAQSPSPHALDRLNLLDLSASQTDPSRVFDRALDRELVTRQFFLRFRAAVADVADALQESCRSESRESVQQEALLILSRLLFLSFIQTKGWLNQERRFLIDRADRACRENRSFMTEVLLPLFFGCLNTPSRDRDGAAAALGVIPYLNGGLFEPSPFERRNAAMNIPNELMRRVLEEVFERFDFSTDESDGSTTHVDPEMLGKVFESLMAAEERAASGSFYTPKGIVDVLASGAITDAVAAGDEEMRGALRSMLRGEAMPAIVQNNAIGLLRALESLTVLDPACGSGAFLLSALHIMERLIVAIAGMARPNLRQSIVERSLYGVDVKHEAVRLCELRLWLAIVSGTGCDVDSIRPLPNLDRNILQGNSLLSPLDFLGTAPADVYRGWAYGIRAQQALIDRYRSAPSQERPALYRLLRGNDRRLATDLLVRAIEADERELQIASAPRRDLFGDPIRADETRCRELQERIVRCRRELEKLDDGEVDFFSFDVHFAHVMASGGFHVILGNPPWVRNSRIEPAARAMYRDRYRLFGRAASNATAFHQPDLSLAFFERAAALVAPGGIVSMLMPAKIMNAAYGAPLRRYVERELSVVSVSDWSSERKSSFGADTFPLGLTVRKASAQPGHKVRIEADGRQFDVMQGELRIGEACEWSLLPPDVARILRRISARFPPLCETLQRRPVMGVKTGDNRNFFIESGSIDCGWMRTAEGVDIPTEFICRCVRGRDVRRWSTSASQWMLWPPARGFDVPPPWLQQLAMRRGVEPHVFRLSYVRPEHVGIKVAWKDVSRGMAAVVLPDVVNVAGHAFPLVPNQTLYSIDAVSLDEAYAIAALLNSTVADALLLAHAERAKDEHYRYFGRTVGNMPLPLMGQTHPAWDELVRGSRSAHRTRDSDSLDHLTASLFEVTPDELEVLRAHVARRLAAR